MKSSFVYVHGTNGSGKSTLARAVLAAAGGADGWGLVQATQAPYTRTKAGVLLVGRYGNACGGADGVQPYSAVTDMVSKFGAMKQLQTVFGEGLITPGVRTCAQMALNFQHHAFIFLDTPVDQCIANVLKRRARKANDKEYNPANLYKKHQSAASWADRLEKAGLNVLRLRYPEALEVTLYRLGLKEPSLNDLLN